VCDYGCGGEGAIVNAYRIGVLSDTHVPELCPALPDEVAETLRGVNLIVHLGDITGEKVLCDLSRLAPVVALRGDHDRLPLPRQTLIHVEGMCLGLIHGKPSLYRELAALPARSAGANGDPWWRSLLPSAEGSLSDVDAILFGNTNRPYMARHDGVLVFSPGSVYQRTPQMLRAELAKNPPFAIRRALQRLLEHAEKAGDAAVMPPSIGLLSISDGAIHAEVRTLTTDSGPDEETYPGARPAGPCGRARTRRVQRSPLSLHSARFVRLRRPRILHVFLMQAATLPLSRSLAGGPACSAPEGAAPALLRAHPYCAALPVVTESAAGVA
jgi:putative phosphoesterase